MLGDVAESKSMLLSSKSEVAHETLSAATQDAIWLYADHSHH